jgi:hypothetical protein
VLVSLGHDSDAADELGEIVKALLKVRVLFRAASRQLPGSF